MTYYEIKKVFVRKSSWCALALLAGLVFLLLYTMLGDTFWIDSEGEWKTGLVAVRETRKAKQEWSGLLTEERIAQVIEENNRINSTPEAQSDDPVQDSIAAGWRWGYRDILYLLNYAYGSFSEWAYDTADTLTPERAGEFYLNRLRNLEDWLEDPQGGMYAFSDAEKEFLIRQYEELESPFLYEYQDGWKNLFNYASTVTMITTMVIGFLCAGIFSDEFRLKSDAIFFSSVHGRRKANAAKVKAGFLIATVVYWGEMLLYTASFLAVFGAGGIHCPIQSLWGNWKSFYNITNGQEYLLVVLGGYLGCVFMTVLVMLVSAALKSSRLAIIIPFVLIFLPSFLSGIVADKILGVLPDQLLQMSNVVIHFNLYEIGGKVIGAAPILIVIYLVLAVILLPVIYKVYKNHQIA